MIQWNPKLVPINIIELILLVNSRGLLISRFVSDLRKIFRLNTRPLILTQEEVIRVRIEHSRQCLERFLLRI